MGPVIVILVAAVLIAAGLLSASRLGEGVGIILALAGIATIIVGMTMLFNPARQEKR